MNTKFDKDNFNFHGGYLTYLVNGDYRDSRFIARFKYSSGDKGRFVTFLIKNFTVEEYFAKSDAGFSPATILESKGYVSSVVRKGMKHDGYTVFTTETYRDHFEKFVSSCNNPANDCSEFWARCGEELNAIRAVKVA